MTTVSASGYTRVTLVGTRRRVDVVLPNDEPVGRLLPEIVRLTGEPPTAPPSLRHLAAADGTLLDADATLADVPDGALLRLVGMADAPPPPVVHDVVEEIADDLDHRRGRWGRGPRHVLAVAALAGAGVLTADLLVGALHGQTRTVALIALPVLLLALGAAIGRTVPEPLGTALIVTGGAAGIHAAVTLSSASATATAIAIGAVAATTAGCLGLGTRWGRGALLGGLTGLALVAGWALPLLAGVDPVVVASWAAVASAFLLGLLPRWALIASGLTALDDRRARDADVSRQDVASALATAHQGLSVAASAVAASAAAAGWVLGTRPGSWTGASAGLLVVVLVLRARSFPLAAPVLAMAVAAAVTGLALGIGWPVARPVLAVAAVLAAAALVVEPPEHVRARVRRFADRLETVAVVASVPVALGVSGVYGTLLTVF
jgi:type VII secretion integral membrane protein EccD